MGFMAKVFGAARDEVQILGRLPPANRRATGTDEHDGADLAPALVREHSD
jgi:hypothetical protein